MEVMILWSNDPIFYEAVWGDDLSVGKVIMKVHGQSVNPVDSIDLVQKRFGLEQIEVGGLDKAFVKWGEKSYFCGSATVQSEEVLNLLHERLTLLIPALADEHQ